MSFQVCMGMGNLHTWANIFKWFRMGLKLVESTSFNTFIAWYLLAWSITSQYNLVPFLLLLFSNSIEFSWCSPLTCLSSPLKNLSVRPKPSSGISSWSNEAQFSTFPGYACQRIFHVPKYLLLYFLTIEKVQHITYWNF